MRKILGKLHYLLIYSRRKVLSEDSVKICLTISIVLTNNYSKTTKISQCRQKKLVFSKSFYMYS